MTGRRGYLRSVWKALWSPAGAISMGALLIIGLVAGALMLGGMLWAVEATSKDEFCISCHEMSSKPFAEMKGTVHRNNLSGVTAGCADCHIPKPFFAKVTRKVKSVKELYGHYVTGVISTPEKYEAHRLEMAGAVWREMKSTDSRECRSCHDEIAMNVEGQGATAAGMHKMAFQGGMTCIDCHQGIAHELPEDAAGHYRDAVKELPK